jgi:SAM-dependent methyltransferase
MQENKSFYNKNYETLKAAGKSGWTDEESPNFAIHLNDIRETLDAHFLLPGRALEAGCGAGNWSFVLADMGWDVTGVDLSEKAIAWANEKAAGRNKHASGSVRFFQHDILDLGFLGNDVFDFVLDGFLLHCLIGEARSDYLSQVRKVLSPEGVFMIQSFCAEDIAAPEWEGWNIDPATRCQVSDDGMALKYIGNRESLRSEIQTAGFEILDDKISAICGGMLVAVCRKV